MKNSKFISQRSKRPQAARNWALHRSRNRPGTETRVTSTTFFSEGMPVPTGRELEPLLVRANLLRFRAEQLRPEFASLASQWQRDPQHLSQVSKKVLHPAYFRIIGMGAPAVPLLLEALRDRPAHWFLALKATTNADPAGPGLKSSRD